MTFIEAHPHTTLSLPAIKTLSLDPILFSQVPALDTVLIKQISLLDEQSQWPDTGYSKDQIKSAISTVVTTYLKPQFVVTGSPGANGNVPLPLPTKPDILEAWLQATTSMVSNLPVESIFPVADLWRLAVLNAPVCLWIDSRPPSKPNDPLEVLLPKAALAVDSSSKGARNFTLIMLRFLCNCFSHACLANRLLRTGIRDQVTTVLIASLLHPDAAVRTASASLAFNAAAVLQKERVDAVKSGRGIQSESEDDLADWQVEVMTAVVEALNREKENEEVGALLPIVLSCGLEISHAA